MGSFATALLLVVLAQADGPRADDLVRGISEKPDLYSQICSALLRDATFSIRVSFSGSSSTTEHYISGAQYARLRAVREPAIRTLIAGLADDKLSTEIARRRLCMLVDLNATSSLPFLKKAAERLAKLHAEGAPEAVVNWGRLERLEDAKKKAILATADVVDRLGDVLSAILAILRQEKFEPLRTSRLEKQTQDVLAEQREKPWSLELAERIRGNQGEVAPKDRPLVTRDPLTNEHVMIWQYPKVALTAEEIADILSWVDAYEKLPAERRLDAKGMTPWPLHR